MEKKLHERLVRRISLSSPEALAGTISAVGVYVADLPISDPVTLNSLRYYQSVYSRRRSYREFRIPKKSGGERVITAPAEGRFKEILTTLAFILGSVYQPTEAAMAFVPGRSIVDNARRHLGRNYVLNLDLKDFFPSVTANMVERSLTDIGISPITAGMISTLCTYPDERDGRIVNVLPQGSPASPVLSNICTMRLDRQLDGLSRRFHLSYSRYADDITFSSNHHVYHEEGAFMKELRAIITRSGFTINEAKTRLCQQGDRQEVTGLTVNRHPNVSRHYIKRLRTQIHLIRCKEHPSVHDVHAVQGKLYFLSMVKGRKDPTLNKLFIKLNRAIKDKHLTQ